jgi:2'-5' RNA ligase
MEHFQAELKHALPFKEIRWTRAAQFHLTVRFLGSVDAEQVDDLVVALLKECRFFSPLQLTAAGFGVFPGGGPPRVFWVGMQEASESLKRLWKAVQKATQPFTAEPAADDFIGHITLARLNHLPRREVEQLAEAVKTGKGRVFGQWTATDVELFRSELSSQGARHSLVAAIPLTGK